MVRRKWIPNSTYLFQSHSVLNEKRYPRVKVAHIFLENEVLLGL